MNFYRLVAAIFFEVTKSLLEIQLQISTAVQYTKCTGEAMA